jgi:HlyD family secretion protein
MIKFILRISLALMLLGAAYGGYRYFERLPQKQLPVATAKVRRGDVIVRAFSRGELRAVRSVTLNAPNLFATVQVTKLAPLGSLAREKDLIVEFDDSELLTLLEETLLEVEQIDEQMKKSRADLDIRNNQDQVELLKSRYAVRRAELEVKRNELLADIDAKKNILNLEESRRRLKQEESDIQSRLAQALAEIDVMREKRAKSMIDVGRAKQRIAQSKVLSPITGLVSIRQNRGGFAGSFGQQVPDIREGDTLQPGQPVADVLDLSEMEIIAKVGELDRANLREGQEVQFVLDAVPDQTFHGKIKSMSGTAVSNPFGGDPGKKFDVLFSVDMKELMTGLGAKPGEIQKVLETAARNASKAERIPAPAAPVAVGGAGQRDAMLAGMIAQLPGPVKKDIEKDLNGKKIQDLPAEQRNRIFTKVQNAMKAAAAAPGAGGPRIGGFTEADRENAKLPLPPEEDSQLEVLLRPGLLADVEIIIEKIPDAIHIPNQALFEKDGRQFVYVQNLTGNRFEERTVKLAKRSESVLVIVEGLKPGETIALGDPTASKKNNKDEKPSGASKSIMPSAAGKGTTQ